MAKKKQEEKPEVNKEEAKTAEPEKPEDKPAEKSEDKPEKTDDKPVKKSDDKPEKPAEKKKADKTSDKPEETEEQARERRRRRRKRQQFVYTLVALLVLAAIGTGIFFGVQMLTGRIGGGEHPLRATPEADQTGASAMSSADEAALANRTPEQILNDSVEEMISQMPLEDKVAALFVVTPEQLTGNAQLTSADKTLEDSLQRYPVGGIVFGASNFTDSRQMSNLLSGAQRMSRYPLFLGVSETGGSMSAVAGALSRETLSSPQNMAALGNASTAQAVGQEIASYLKEAGFNLNLAPHASLSSDPANDTLYGSDAQTVASLSAAFVTGEREGGILTAVDAFPLPGEQDAGGVLGTTTTSLTMANLQEEAFEPFRACINAGVDIIILSNISASRAIGTSVNIPCSISEAMVTGQLRGSLSFEGIIMTAPFDQNTITAGYTSDHIAVAAIVAGADMIYRPQDLSLAHAGIMEAIENGVITEERINQSLRRIYRLKLKE